jgi:hypothetical protein
LHGAAQAGLLFPLNWFYLLFDPPAATNLLMLSTYALAALGSYLYARRAGATLAGAATTSIVYQWSGFLIAQVGHTNVVQTAALLPWLLWALDGYGATGERRRGLILAAVVALQAFTGHQQTLAYSLLLAAAYAVVMWRANAPARNCYLRSLALLAAGVLLAAVQILPTYELMRNSLRAQGSFDFFTSFSLPPRFVWTFFAPYVVGGGDGRLFRAPYVGEPFYGEFIGYVSVGALMLAALAVLHRRDARTKFWAAVALVALALALGRHWPLKLYAVIYYVPVLNLFRVPARHMMEIDFALAVLAGRGLTALVASEDHAKLKRGALAAGACVFALTCLAVTLGRPAAFRLGRDAPVSFLRAPELFLPVALAALSAWALWKLAWRRSRAAVLFMVAVVALDLCVWGQSSGWRVSSPSRASELWRVPEAIKFVRERRAQGEGLLRVLTVPQGFDPAVPATATAPDTVPFVLALQPDTYMMHGVENAAGYDGFGLARYSRLADDMKVWGDLSDPERSLRGAGREFDLLNVRYVLTRQPPRAGAQGPTASPVSVPSAPAPSSPPLSSSPASKAAPKAVEQLTTTENLNAPTLDRGERLTFEVPGVEADRIALVTSLAWSVDVREGTTVGSVRVRAADGREFEFALRAGEHSSEWAFDRPDIRRRVRHKRAPLATSYAVEDAQGRYEGHAYAASFTLPERLLVTGVEIAVARLAEAPDLGLSVARAALADGGTAVALRAEWMGKTVDAAGTSPAQTPGQTSAQGAGGGRWKQVAQAGVVRVYENTRSLPRAWLAGGAAVLRDEAALEVIRTGKMPDGSVWEPRRTALVNAPPPGIVLADADTADARTDVTLYEPNRVELKTDSPAPSLLVLSENHYPGWRAYLDGRAVETLRVNYNLRGVALPPGAHEVTFVYRPKSVVIGLIISLLTAAALTLWRLRRSQK